MRLPSEDGFVAVWEAGRRRHPLDRAILMLRLASPDTTGESAADWTLGRRNRALLELHQAAFGARLPCWVQCPECREKLEFALDAGVLLGTAEAGGPADGAVEFKGEQFRVPTSRAIARAAGTDHPREAAGRLAEACRIVPARDRTWSETDLAELGTLLAAADPLAETSLNLACPGCGRAWEETLDIPAFLWSEIEARAKQALADVHALASAYGWSEREILSLSGDRRGYYLQLAEG